MYFRYTFEFRYLREGQGKRKEERDRKGDRRKTRIERKKEERQREREERQRKTGKGSKDRIEERGKTKDVG